MSPVDTNRNRQRIAVLILLLLLLGWTCWDGPAPVMIADVAKRQAQLDEAIRQRDTLPEGKPAGGGGAVLLVAPPPPPDPAPPEPKPPVPQKDVYMERVMQQLRAREQKFYDESAQRKENFEKQVKTEEAKIAGQMAQVADFKVPPAQVALSYEVKQRLWYCCRCHTKKSPAEMAETFAQFGAVH